MDLTAETNSRSHAPGAGAAGAIRVAEDASRLLVDFDYRGDWRKRMGIEPTFRAATARNNGFEV